MKSFLAPAVRILRIIAFHPLGKNGNYLRLFILISVLPAMLFATNFLPSTVGEWARLYILGTISLVLILGITISGGYYSPVWNNRHVSKLGLSHPQKIIDKHPERFKAFDELTELVESQNGDLKSESFKVAGDLIFAGKITSDDIHLAAIAVRLGEITKAGMLGSIERLRSESLPLTEGLL